VHGVKPVRVRSPRLGSREATNERGVAGAQLSAGYARWGHGASGTWAVVVAHRRRSVGEMKEKCMLLCSGQASVRLGVPIMLGREEKKKKKGTMVISRLFSVR
jgi:hypothetical protein